MKNGRLLLYGTCIEKYTFIQRIGITPFSQRTAVYAGGNGRVLAWIQFDNTERQCFCLLLFVFFEYERFQQKVIDWTISPGRC